MKIKGLLSLLVLITLNSCVSTFDGSFYSPSFSVKDNFRIVSTLEGQAQAEYIFGIGGAFRDALVNEAKRNMYSSYALQPNQNITNITVDSKVTSFLLPILFMSKRVTVSADVIEFYDNNSNLKASGDLGVAETVNSSKNKIENSETDVSSNWKVIDISKNQIWTAEDSKYFELITSFKEKKPETLRIAKAKDLKVGDVVSFKSENNENRIFMEYGIIKDIDDQILKVNTYPKSGQKEVIEEYFYYFRKVVY